MESLLTDKQKEFLYSTTLSELVTKDSCIISFINELFDTESENTPLHESIFLVTIFEFVSCLMNIYSPSQVLSAYNKADNRIKLIKNLGYNVCEDLIPSDPLLPINDLDVLNKVLIKYLVNPFKQILIVTIEVGDQSFIFQTKIKTKPKILSYSINYRIKDSVDFLYKMTEIYWELIELMPKEEIVVCHV